MGMDNGIHDLLAHIELLISSLMQLVGYTCLAVRSYTITAPRCRYTWSNDPNQSALASFQRLELVRSCRPGNAWGMLGHIQFDRESLQVA
jgi:hypothetical protein